VDYSIVWTLPETLWQSEITQKILFLEEKKIPLRETILEGVINPMEII